MQSRNMKYSWGRVKQYTYIAVIHTTYSYTLLFFSYTLLYVWPGAYFLRAGALQASLFCGIDAATSSYHASPVQ
jgi:hypothetical protein